jgi:hypothetical protein
MHPNLNELCHGEPPMQQRRHVEVVFDEEPLIRQTMTKLLKTIM